MTYPSEYRGYIGTVRYDCTSQWCAGRVAGVRGSDAHHGSRLLPRTSPELHE